MIRALLTRRIWLLLNHLTSTVVLSFILPIIIFIFTNLAFRNILVNSIYDINFDVWIYPSMIFLVSSLCIIPSIFRDLFDLRIHKKVLTYLSISPWSKQSLISSILVVSLIEAFSIAIFSLILYSFIIPFPFNFLETIALLIYLLIFILVFGNILITISILSDKSATFLLSLMILLFFTLFGSGLIIELNFFPSSINYMLSVFPISMIVSAMQSYLFSGFINWGFTLLPILISIGILLINAALIRNKLRQ